MTSPDTDALVEAVARALNVPRDATYEARCRAAILETLRGIMEPSEGMIESGVISIVAERLNDEPPLKNAWRAMIAEKIREVEGG